MADCCNNCEKKENPSVEELEKMVESKVCMPAEYLPMMNVCSVQGLAEAVSTILMAICCVLQNIVSKLKNHEDRITALEKDTSGKDALDALKKLIQNLEDKGIWKGGINGGFVDGMGIAGGNINLFGGKEDGAHWIRTNKGSTDDDLAGGI